VQQGTRSTPLLYFCPRLTCFTHSRMLISCQLELEAVNTNSPTYLHAGRGQARADSLKLRLLAEGVASAAHKQERLTQLDKRRVP